jgi:esterase/lipase superfamily enzyme
MSPTGNARPSFWIGRLLVIFMSILLAAGGLAPAPAGAAGQRSTRYFSKVPRGVQIYFATTRLNEGSRTSPQYAGARHLDLGSGSLEFGTAALLAPRNLVGPNQAGSGIQYRDLLKQDTDLWHNARVNFMGCFEEKDLLEKVSKCSGKVCVYVHGYDKPFEEALQDATMLFADYMQLKDDKHQFVPILFSWPSAGGRSKYSVDEANLEWSKKSFDLFMDRIVSSMNPDGSLEVIGHSMGNQLLVPYLTQEQADRKYPFINNLFLCSADLDFHAVEAARDRIEKCVAERVYISVSDKDRPLIMSQYMHGQPRLGRPVDPPGAQTGDSSLPSASASVPPAAVPNKLSSGDFWLQLGLEAAEFWFGPSSTDTPEVLAWLAQNPSLDQEFGEKSRLLDVSDLCLHNMGHGVPWSIVSAIMAGYQDFPQLKACAVHKRPDRTYLGQCGGKPRVLYRYLRLQPLP